ncbi:MAG: hypothetical protein QOJ62_3105 [Actinomycetota bacterium]|nr:hypothetical protein [Actinomycetota bacterium]
MDISCQFATSVDSPEHIAAAETLGYRRAWLFATPARAEEPGTRPVAHGVTVKICYGTIPGRYASPLRPHPSTAGPCCARETPTFRRTDVFGGSALRSGLPTTGR